MERPEAGPPTTTERAQLQLTSLAPELKFAIFTNLQDVISAKSLALTSSSFYYTFIDAQSLILTQILQNEITADLMHAASAAYQATHIPVWTKQAVQEFLNEYFGNSISHEAKKWNLTEALHMSKVHSCVEFFATEFASSALSKNPTTRGSNAAPSCTEMIRIKRILYRFELYCNLFRNPSYDRMIRGERNCLLKPSPFRAQEQRPIFFDKFSPWENEQLGCIHEYLIEVITLPFNDVAEHDVEWGELDVPWVHTFGSAEIFYKEGYLLNGLNFLFQLCTAKTYDDRHVLLSKWRSGGSFLSDALKPPRRLQYDGVPLKEFNNEEEKLLVRSPFDEDIDSGPAEAWRWAHAAYTKDHFYFLDDHRRFRQRGYVMWDLTRLLRWKFFTLPVRIQALERSSGYLERLEKEAEVKKQMDSWKERSRIWLKGGRGWWALGDESRIQWPQRDQKPLVSAKVSAKKKCYLALPKAAPESSG